MCNQDAISAGRVEDSSGHWPEQESLTESRQWTLLALNANIKCPMMLYSTHSPNKSFAVREVMFWFYIRLIVFCLQDSKEVFLKRTHEHEGDGSPATGNMSSFAY